MDADGTAKPDDEPAEHLAHAIDADRASEGDVRPEPDSLPDAVSTGEDTE